MEPLIEIQDLDVSYGDRPALEGLSMQVSPGSIVALVGPNGAGKTTLCKSLFGQIPREQGSINVCGYNPYEYSDRRQMWNKARWVSDRTMLYEDLSVREYLEFAAQSYGVPRKQTTAVTTAMGMTFDLLEHWDVRIRNLSAGNQRKVHVASGFFSGEDGPSVVVMDEPMVGLDPPSRLLLTQYLRQYVGESFNQGRAVLISSHNLPELSSLADYVVMLFQGKVYAEGNIQELAARLETTMPYEIVLFDAQADALSRTLAQQLDLETEAIGNRVVRFHSTDSKSVQSVLRVLGEQEFKVREVRESMSALERLFLNLLQTGGQS